jgi:hypothetical protein
LTVGSDGVAYAVWADRASAPQRLWFCRNHPDSGLSASLPLTTPPAHPSDAQLGFSAVLSGDGTLHTVWQTNGPGVSQMHYQSRPRDTEPVETLIESQGYLIENPVVAADPENGLHVVFEASPSGVTQVRYMQFTPGRGWDAISTEVTFPEEGSVSHPQPLPLSTRELSVAYAQFPGNQPRLRVRRRVLEPPPTAALSGPAQVRPGLLLGPNPIRPGEVLHLAWSGPAGSRPPMAEFFDLSGRRVAGRALGRSGSRWEARVPGDDTRAWSSGVYFVRLRDDGSRAARLVVIR